MFGTTELVIIGGIIVFIFGAKRLPEIGKGLGGAIKEFRKVKKDISQNREEIKRETEEVKRSIENELVEKVIEDLPTDKKGVAN